MSHKIKIDLCKLFGVKEGQEFYIDSHVLKYKIENDKLMAEFHNGWDETENSISWLLAEHEIEIFKPEMPREIRKMKNFDWNAFGRKEIAVWCKTEDEAKDFCKQSHEHGFDWYSKNSREEETHFGAHEEMCYLKNTFASKEYCEGYYLIIEWSDYMYKLFTKSDLKDGDFVLRRNGQVEVAIPSIGVYINERGFNYTDENDNDFNFPSKFEENEWDIMEVRRPMRPSECQFCIFEFNWGEVMFKREAPEEMTLEEVCKALGKKIKIVDKKEEN